MLLIIFNISQILRLCLLHDVSMIWTQYLQNFNGNKMTEKTMFKSIKSRPSSLKKITFSEKTEQRAVTQFAQTSEKNSRDSTFLKQSEKKPYECEPFLSIPLAHKTFRRKGEYNGWCTGGKTIISELQSSAKWSYKNACMLILYKDRKGFILTHTLSNGKTKNFNYYCNVI